jgi:hypothetical protein
VRAQGESLWIIIAAALALIALVVIGFMFVQRWGLFGKGLNQCNGQCVADSKACPAGTTAIPMTSCESSTSKVENGFCCLRTG